MFNYVIIAGSGAITYLLAQRGVQRTSETKIAALAEYLLYVMIDMLVVYFCMTPLGRVTRVDDMTSGMTQIQYGNTAILFSFIVSVLVGIAALAFKKKVDISVEIEEKRM